MSNPFGSDELDFDAEGMLRASYENAASLLAEERPIMQARFPTELHNPLLGPTYRHRTALQASRAAESPNSKGTAGTAGTACTACTASASPTPVAAGPAGYAPLQDEHEGDCVPNRKSTPSSGHSPPMQAIARKAASSATNRRLREHAEKQRRQQLENEQILEKNAPFTGRWQIKPGLP